MLWSFALLMMILPLCMSCGSSSDDDTPTLNFTKDLIVGNFSWTVTSVQVTKGKPIHTPKEGDHITFFADNTCESSESMETAYRITDGKIETYYARTQEPIYVYILTAIQGDELTVLRNGTLSDYSTCTLKMKKTVKEE